MKKLLCVLLALVMLFSFAACGDNTPDDNESTTAVNPADKTFPWPSDARLFADVPAIKDSLKNYTEKKNEHGYVYEMSADDIDYDDFRKYIAELEKAGFGIYKSSPLSGKETADVLPKELAEDTFNASWSGNRRGLYVAAFWYGDEYYEKYELPEDVNVKLIFYTYNAFETVN